MSHRVYIKYDDIISHEKDVIKFLIDNSEQFSVTVVISRPYSQFPPVFNCDKLLQPYVIKYIYERNEWPVNFLGKRRHQIMVVCRCCKEIRKQLLIMDGLFIQVNNNLPEDICFYRNGKLWFGTITHEKIAFIENITAEDIAFFRQCGIQIYV